MVATPGRLEDFLDRKLFNFRVLQVLVLDEADRMLDMGVLFPSIQRASRRHFPKNAKPCVFPPHSKLSVAHLVHDYMRNPGPSIVLDQRSKPAENVRFQCVRGGLER